MKRSYSRTWKRIKILSVVISRLPYLQTFFVFIAFALMVILSYMYAGDIENKHLIRDAEDTFHSTEIKIKADLQEPKTTLIIFSQTVRSMILNGVKISDLQEYFTKITQYMLDGEEKMNSFDGVHAYFYKFGEIDGFNRPMPEGFNVLERPWYKTAIEANGKVVMTKPYINTSGNLIVAHSRLIFDDKGEPLGVIALDIKLDRIGWYAVNARVYEGSYGILADEDFKIIAHPDHSYLDKTLKQLNDGALLESALRQGKEISGYEVKDYLGNQSILFVRKLEENGWYMAIMTPKEKYNENLENMMKVMIALGSVLAVLLSFILLRIISAKIKADKLVETILDVTPLALNLWDKNLRNTKTNREAVKLFDLSNKEEYLNRFYEFSPVYQPDGRLSSEKAPEYINKAFEEGYCRFEWVHQKLNGEFIPCEVTLIRITYEDNFMVVGYIRDLREQKAMLAEIHKENENSRVMAHWYNSILNAIPLPISVTDADARWAFINTAVEKILGITLKDAMGKPCSNWGSVVCNTPDCGIACVKRGITQTYFSTGDISLQVDTAILKDLKGDTIGYIEIAQDITNLKLMAKKQADAEAASRAKSAFLARISHEIRTPMNAILGITEIQLQDESLPPNIKEAFSEIYNSSDLLISIINDILDLSKIEADKMELNIAKYETASLINDIAHINMMRSSKFVEFELDVDESIPSKFLGDELRIKQILNNLLSNAYKYTEEGVIKLSVHIEPASEDGHDTLVFCVSDTGQGMTEEQISTIFTTEYSRFNPEINRSVEGTGLGMNITWRLVRMMNGMISVESQPEKGTKFTVRLPQKRASSVVLGKELTEKLRNFRISSSAQMKRAKITREYMPYGRVLIVDDVYSNLYVAKGLMAPYGLAIDTATSGFEAIEKVKAGELYDIIFMDHMMPKMDGVEATKIIRDLGYKNSIVVLTANAITGQAKFFLENGFDEFISKPIDIRQLNTILNNLIRNKQPPEVIAEANKQKSDLDADNQNNLSKPDSVLQTVFLLDVKQSLPILEETLERIDIASESDLRLFAINVHAMKSALANIGEASASKRALTLELAGKEQNRSFIKLHARSLIDSIRLIEARMQLENDNSASSDDIEEDTAFLREQLQIISKACAVYDERPINAALEALKKLSWKKETKVFIDKIAEQILYGDFDEVGKLAKEQ
ncbi:MAG: ATP-binding protein [Fibromonadales bacterium]|nr:ATP-binding protein [Fibromonadales bacterium]